MKRTPLRRLGARKRRELEALRLFRSAVLERAGHRCERCGARGLLEAHHVRPRSRGGSNDIDNGAALCRSCHRRIHDHTVSDWTWWIS